MSFTSGKIGQYRADHREKTAKFPHQKVSEAFDWWSGTVQRCGGQGGTSTRFFIDQCCQGILQEIPLEMPLNMPEMRNKMSQKK